MEEKEFMEDGVTPNPNYKKPEEQGGDKGDQKPKTFTEAEHQAELDRVAAKTRAEAKAQAEKDKADAIAKAVEEAERRSKLSAEEKAKELKAKEDADRAKREEEITLRENRADAKDKFAEVGLPFELVDFVVVLDKDQMQTKIDSLKTAFEAAVQKGVAEKLNGKEPPKDLNNTNNSNDKTDEPVAQNYM